MAKSVDECKPPTRRPDNSAFKQQRLPAWSPMLTAGTVLPFFFLMGALCVLLGAGLLVTVRGTREFKVSQPASSSSPPVTGRVCPGEVINFELRKIRDSLIMLLSWSVITNDNNNVQGDYDHTGREYGVLLPLCVWRIISELELLL